MKKCTLKNPSTDYVNKQLKQIEIEYYNRTLRILTKVEKSLTASSAAILRSEQFGKTLIADGVGMAVRRLTREIEALEWQKDQLEK